MRALAIDGRDLFGNDRVSRIGTLAAGRPGRDDRRTSRGTRPAPGPWSRVATRSPIVACTSASCGARRASTTRSLAARPASRVTTSAMRARERTATPSPEYVLSGPKGIVQATGEGRRPGAHRTTSSRRPSNWKFHKQGTSVQRQAGADGDLHARGHRLDVAGQQPHPGLPARRASSNTLKTLDKYGIKHAGAGKNLRQAAKPSYLKVNGQTVGIVACIAVAVAVCPGDHADQPGALPCKSDEAFAAIRAARKKADVLIVFPHWGVEYTRARLP